MYRLVARGLYELRYPKFFRQLREMQDNHYLQLDDLERMQDNMLRRVIEKAFQDVPYYASLSKSSGIHAVDINSQQELALLPTILKSHISADRRQFLADKHGPAIQNSTGGSTGEPLKYYLNKETSRYGQLVRQRAWTIPGYHAGDKLCKFGGGSLYNKANRRASVINRLTNTVAFSSYGIDENGLALIYEHIQSRRPSFFYGYASSWLIFSDYLLRKGLRLDYSPKGLFSTSEVLTDRARSRIEEAMGVTVFDQYGLYDGGVSAHECEAHCGKHIDFENAILQVVDDDGRSIREGTGRVLATSLHNDAMPFIRYDTGDIATVTYEPCKCGRKSPRLLRIEGRTTDYLLIDGVYIGSPVLTVLMGKFDLSTYRIVQEDANSITVDIVVPEYRDEDPGRVLQIRQGILDSFGLKVPSAKVSVRVYKDMSELGTFNKHKFIENRFVHENAYN